MASSLPPSCSSAARSLSCCFWDRSCVTWRSIWRFCCQRENRIQPTTRIVINRAIDEYSRGFLKTDLGACSELCSELGNIASSDRRLRADAPTEFLVGFVIPQADDADGDEIGDIAIHVQPVEFDIQN